MTVATGSPRGPRRGIRLSPGTVALLLVPVLVTLYVWTVSGRRSPDAASGSRGDRLRAAQSAPAPAVGPAPMTPPPRARDAGSRRNGTAPARTNAGWPWLLRASIMGPLVAFGLVCAALVGLLLLVLGDPPIRPPVPPAPRPPSPPGPPPTDHAKGRRPLPPPPGPAGPEKIREPAPRHVEPALFLENGPWKVIASSVAGTSHLKSRKPCQDASYCRILHDGVLVGAVADGAGSARFSDEGAQIAVKRAVDTVADAIRPPEGAPGSAHVPSGPDGWHQVLRAAMQVALGHIEIAAALRGTKPRELATTLLLFAGLRDAVIAAQIGDGAIVIRDGAGHLHALTTPQSGEYANTTTFLVSPGALDSVQHRAWDRAYTGVAALTDGLQRLALAMPTGDPHGPFFTPLFAFADRAAEKGKAIEELDSFLRSGKVADRADDDLTLMVARKTS